MGTINNSPKLEIFTLGKFEVRLRDKIISEDSGRSTRVWDLFKYIITNHNKGVIPELALEELWPDQDYSDPRGAVRALIFRLRKYMSSEEDGSDYIIFSQGYYRLNPDIDYWLDIEEFEELYIKSNEMKKIMPDQAEVLLWKALDLYKGNYLPETYYSQWTLPLRYKYYNIYHNIILELISLLNNRKDYQQIIELSQKALLMHPYEEDINLHYIDALINEGKTKQALDHYYYITKNLLNDVGMEPSLLLRQLLIKQSDENDSDNIDIEDALIFEDEAIEGALFCSWEVFKEILKYERRRSERLDKDVFLTILTLELKKKNIAESKIIASIKEIEDILALLLRKGDVITRWNRYQYIIMLSGVQKGSYRKIIERIRDSLTKRFINEPIYFNIELKTVVPIYKTK